jgi:hypothetical protein
MQGMQIPTKRVRENYNDNENKEILSNLSECVLLHILSFLNTKLAVQTCILSTRWKNLWKCVPAIVINYSHFRHLKGFDEFVSRFFSMRDRSTALQVLDFYGEGPAGAQSQLEIILGYIVSHNVRKIRINVEKIQHFPPCLFSRHNLTSLHISVAYPHRTLFPNSLNFPALTNLSLQSFDFSVDDDGRVEPFSAFNKLNSLIIKYCKVLDNQNLCISSATLAHLTIIYCGDFELYTPSLRNFVYKGYPTVQQLCGSKSNLSSIKHANIEVSIYLLKSGKTSLVLRNWYVELANIESLTISSTAIQVLYGWFHFLLQIFFT